MSTIRPLIGRESFKNHFLRLATDHRIHGKKVFNNTLAFIDVLPDEIFHAGTLDVAIREGWDTLGVQQMRKCNLKEYKEVFIRTRDGTINDRNSCFLFNAENFEAPSLYITPKSMHMAHSKTDYYERYPSIRCYKKFPQVRDMVDQFVAGTLMAGL